MREYQRIVAQQQTKELWAVVLSIVVLTLCLGVVLVAYTYSRSTSEGEPAPTATAMLASGGLTITPASSTPTPPTPASTVSTDTPMPTQSPTVPVSPSPAVVSPTLPSSPAISSADARGDVIIYDTSEPVAAFPGGVDIQAANVGADLLVSLQPTDGTPAELIEWANEGDVLLWVSLYDPIPDPPAAFTDWVFVLDVDGDQTSGRPPATVLVNPDLGYEAAIGVSYNEASGNYEPYFLVWDAAQLRLVSAGRPRFVVNESRTLIGLALPLASLTENVSQIAGVTLDPASVKGRVAAQSVVGGRKVIDVYPDLPD